MEAPEGAAMGALYGVLADGLRKDEAEVPIQIGPHACSNRGGHVRPRLGSVDIDRAQETRRRRKRFGTRGAAATPRPDLSRPWAPGRGVAHDFSNVLAAPITAHVSGSGRHCWRRGLSPRNLGGADQGSEHGQDLVLERIRILQPSSTVGGRRPGRFGPTVAEAAKVLRATLPLSIHLRLDAERAVIAGAV